MSAPITTSQMAFELPQLSYIDTRWEEQPVEVRAPAAPEHGIAGWMATRVAAFRAWRAESRAMAELRRMSDRELFDVGLNRGDFDRIFNDRFNADLRSRGQNF